MLKRYFIQIEAPNNKSGFDKDLNILWNSVIRLPIMKRNHLSELKSIYFRGMRENWFPLVLLNLYDLLLCEGKKEEADKILRYFKELCQNSDLFSFYLDNGRYNNEIGIFLRCEGDSRNYPILDILECFNIHSFRIQEIQNKG